MQPPNELSGVVARKFGVNQRCPLSPTLFGLYIDEVAHYMERFGVTGMTINYLVVSYIIIFYTRIKCEG